MNPIGKKSFNFHCDYTLDEEKDYQMFYELYKGLNVGEEALVFAKIRDYLLQNLQVAKIDAEVALKWRDHPEVLEEINRSAAFK